MASLDGQVDVVEVTPTCTDATSTSDVESGKPKKVMVEAAPPQISKGLGSINAGASPMIKRGWLSKKSMVVATQGGPGELGPLQFSGKFAGGLMADIKRRAPFCASDWTDAFSAENRGQSLSSICFLFFACLSPAITFGTLFDEGTDGQLGAIEMILSSGISGVVYAFLSGQPLCILGATGPELAYTLVFYNMCTSMGVEFLPARVWQGLWCALFTVLIALFDLNALMSHVTRFTEEIFSALISLIFIISAYTNVIKLYDTDNTVSKRAEAFAGTIIFLGTYGLAMWCKKTKGTTMFTPGVRTFLANYGVTISILVWTGIAALFPEVEIAKLAIPSEFEPTYKVCPGYNYPCDDSEKVARSWFVSPMGHEKDFQAWAIFFCAIPALGLALLGYMDQNLTSLLINRKDHNLSKPPAYHLDLLVCGVFVYPICGFMGLPFTHAATVRSMTHLISLSTRETVALEGGGSTTKVTKVIEQRVTHLVIHILILLALVLAPLLQHVPKVVLYGVFLYMGICSMTGNELFDRLFLWTIWDSAKYPRYKFVGTVANKTMHNYTIFQFSMLVILYAMTQIDEVSVAFPFFIGALVFIRKGINKYFAAADLALLDA